MVHAQNYYQLIFLFNFYGFSLNSKTNHRSEDMTPYIENMCINMRARIPCTVLQYVFFPYQLHPKCSYSFLWYLRLTSATSSKLLIWGERGREDHLRYLYIQSCVNLQLLKWVFVLSPRMFNQIAILFCLKFNWTVIWCFFPWKWWETLLQHTVFMCQRIFITGPKSNWHCKT